MLRRGFEGIGWFFALFLQLGHLLTHWNSVLGALGDAPDGLDFPAAAQGFVDGNEAGGGAGFALGQLGLDRELRALGIEHGKEIVHAAVVTLDRKSTRLNS